MNRFLSMCACVLLVTKVACADSAFQCDVSVRACGDFSTASFEVGACSVIDIATIGEVKDKFYHSVDLFVGTRVSGDVLIIGSAGKAGLLVSCKIPVDPTIKKPQYDALKKELPAQLMAHPEIRARYPGITKSKLEETFKFIPASEGVKNVVSKLKEAKE